MSKNEESREISQEEYNEHFKGDPIQREALKQSYEIRKFEIELYWKRAAYFWTFIGAAFVSYGVFYGSDTTTGEKDVVLLIISCIGLVFSFAWFLVNKGSKFWQENWENHVDLLEDKVNGPLYKTLLYRPDKGDEGWLEAWIVKPGKFSVSKINQLVSFFVLSIWFVLFISSFVETHLFKWAADYFCQLPSKCEESFRCILEIGILLLTLFVIINFFRWGKTNTKKHTPTASVRETEIKDP